MRLATRAVALTAVVSLCLMGLSTVASASNPVGSAKWCKNHPNSQLATCKTGGGGGTGGAPPPPPTITVTVSPNTTADPLVEVGNSEIYAVIEVETSPSFENDPVVIESQQLANACGGAVLFGSLQPGAVYTADSVTVFLDSDGNATVSLYGLDCAPGSDLVDASLVDAPYYTATTVADVLPPNVTPAGVTGFPANEVETGNTTPSGESDVYAVFYVETDPVYAEQTVDIDSAQLFGRCLGPIAPVWISNQGSFATPVASATLDNDGNAVFAFSGSSCAPGNSTVVADVDAGIHSTYPTTFTIVAPTPTI
jgi:hypothetical protein